ncbi:MAG: proline racemase family protein [Armatimonadota bacterium]|nr:proline racemase family protein [Armatimonadota bacterium]
MSARAIQPVLDALRAWRPPKEWAAVTVVDAHAAGEPLRVVTGGVPPIPGRTMLEKRRYAQTHLDRLRRLVICEPRGHADMYACLVTEPVTPDGDLGVLFLHNEGFSTMCGHGIIGLVTVLLETGAVAAEGTVPTLRLDTPAGRVTAWARMREGRVASVAFENVPSFVYALDQAAEVPGFGRVRYDVAFGGAFYAYGEAADLGVRLVPGAFRRLIEVGTAVTRAVASTLPVRHPDAPDLGFVYGTIITGPPEGSGAHSRNVCIFADGQVDRSPTGTGVSGRLAIEFTRRRLDVGQPFVVESLIGTTFTGRILRTVNVGDVPGVIPEIEGAAYVTGHSELVVAPGDPLETGFLLR